MTSILSTISSQFSKAIILGSFLPSTVFMFLFYILVLPLSPSSFAVFAPLNTLDTQWKTALLLFAIILLSGLLYNLNIPITRFYEGYPWQHTWIGRWRVGVYQRHLQITKGKWIGFPFLLDTLEQPATEKDIEAIWKEAGMRLREEYPLVDSSILPTRLGNTIRSFENYPRSQYEISAITIWPRLVAVIDKEYAAAMDDTKITLDFMLNASLLSAFLVVMLLIVGLGYGYPLSMPWAWLTWAMEIVFFVTLSYGLYLAAIGRAAAWGTMVKGAFDLYRWPLLEKLGYKYLPSSMTEEREIWANISQLLIYGDTSPGIDVRLPDYARGQTFAKSGQYDVKLEVARGISAASSGTSSDTLTVYIEITNVDPSNQQADNLIVVDAVTEGMEYEWQSAEVSRGKVRMTGIDPYRFHLTLNLASAESVLLTYRLLSRKKA